MFTICVFLALTAFISSSTGENNCQTGFTLCSPPGATNPHTPSIGTPDFPTLYTSLLHSSLPPPPQKRTTSSASSASLCCNALLSCLTASNLALPFCYDKFTSNYYLPDGSSGSLATGTYTSQSGDTANFVSGDYTFANGTKGNIYSGNEAEKPDTKTLPMPTLYTSAGPEPVIPTSALGALVTLTYTTTLPGTTIEGTTIPATTVPAAVGTETDILKETITTTVSGQVEQETMVVTSVVASTTPARTIEGTTVEGKTIPGTVSTVTTTKVGSPTSTSTKKSAGVRLSGNFANVMRLLLVVAITLFT